MATTVPYVRTSSAADPKASSTVSPASGPREDAPVPAKVNTSEAFARMTAGAPTCNASSATWVRHGIPTPTGSSTHGVSLPAAPRAATTMASAVSRYGVPILTSTPSATEANPSDSEGLSTIAGTAPAANNTFAVKLATTMFVKHCTSGLSRRSRSTDSDTRFDNSVMPTTSFASITRTGSDGRCHHDTLSALVVGSRVVVVQSTATMRAANAALLSSRASGVRIRSTNPRLK